MLNHKNVLVLAAHPDDEVLGCGGAIARLAKGSAKITLVTFTNGVGARNNSDAAGRIENVHKAAKLLGIRNLICFTYPDNEMDSVSLLTVAKDIENILSRDDIGIPDLVLTHSPYDLNVDHRVVYSATMTVFRGLEKYNKTKIMSYEVLSSSEWNPLSQFVANCYVDITDFLPCKIDVWKDCYGDENRDIPHPRCGCIIDYKARVAGSECGVIAAERFMVMREIC